MANRARDFLARFVSDVTRFKTEPVERDLADVGKAADKSSDKVEQSFRKISRAADRTDHDLASHKQAAGEAGSEVGAEFAQNLGQGLASGNITSLAQDTAGGLVSAFAVIPGIGLALAPVAAVAAGIFAGISANAEKMKQGVQSAFDEITSGADTTARFNNRLTDLFGDVQTGIETISRLSERTGVPLDQIRKGLTGGKGAAEALVGQLNALVKAGTTYSTTASATGTRTTTLYSDQARAAQDLAGQLGLAAEMQGRAATNAERYNSALQDVNTTLSHTVGALDRVNRRALTRSQVPDFTSAKRP